jgi:hypothetical protein
MRQLVTLLATLAVAASTYGLDAQERPDFSGKWREKTGQPAAGSGWGTKFTITQRADNLTVERVFYTRYDLQPALKFRYALDGSETKNTVMLGRGVQEFVSTTVWDGHKLAITTTLTFRLSGDERSLTSKTKHVLSLRPPAMPTQSPTLVLETIRDAPLGGSESTTRTEYAKY